MTPRIAIASALLVGPLVGLAACGQGLPYSKSAMQEAKNICQKEAGDQFVQDMAWANVHGGYPPDYANRDPLACIRRELPKLSDDQLRRIDSLIAAAK